MRYLSPPSTLIPGRVGTGTFWTPFGKWTSVPSVAQIGLCAVPACDRSCTDAVFVLQTVIPIGAMSTFVSAGVSTATVLALTGLQYD